MKLKQRSLIVISIAILACGTLWAQAQAPAPANQNHKPAAKASTPAKAAPAAKPMTAKPMAKPAMPAAKPAAHATAAKAAPMAKPMPAKAAAAPVKKTEVRHAMAQKPEMKKPMRPAMAAMPASSKARPMLKSPMAPKMPARAAVKKSTKPEPMAEIKAAAVKEQATRVAISGKMRDPFVSPVVRSNGVLGSGCDTGKRCLVVDQIVLKGIVKSPSGFIAVVENPAKRAYFMRENDPVFNGKVTRITGDTVVFQEEVKDKLGKQSMREVVKKVNAPIV